MPIKYAPPATPIVRLVERYVIEHPFCTSEEIRAGLNAHKNTVSMTLTRLRFCGCVRRVPGERNGRKRVTWESGLEEGIMLPDKRDGAPVQRTVSEWTPHHVRDPLVAALFG